MSFRPRFLATAVGSFPHGRVEDALDLIFTRLPGIPVWPQLPNRGFRENMYVQFSERLPSVVLDETGGRVTFDTAGDIYGPLEAFLERVVLEDVDFFRTSPEFAAGLHAFVERLRGAKPASLQWVKGQITGPVSFGLTITDQAKRSIIYHPEIYEAILKGLAMTARWQVRLLKSVHPEVILFIDEPYLSAFGSAFINVPREQVVSDLTEVVEAIHAEGGLAGVHCCGNTDWSILMETPVDVLNFDAYEFFQGLALYPEPLRHYLERGGLLAWGIVPSSDVADGEEVATLAERIEDEIRQLVEKGLDRTRLGEQSLITPSCGTGGRTVEVTERVLRLTGDLSERLRERIGV